MQEVTDSNSVFSTKIKNGQSLGCPFFFGRIILFIEGLAVLKFRYVLIVRRLLQVLTRNSYFHF